METINYHTVALVAKHLNQTKSKWAVGGSLLLYQHGLIQEVNDMDIIIHKESADCILSKLRNLGNEREVTPLDPYETTYYYEFNILDISMDVMGEFKIKHEEGIYIFPFEEQHLDVFEMDRVEIPSCTLESWYILYQLIPGREEKVMKIENYFLNKGIAHPEVFEKAKSACLPTKVSERIETLYEKVI